MIKCQNCKMIFQSYKDFNNHLFLKGNKKCKESYKTEICEFCNKKFRKSGLSFHILQYSKDCFNYYLNKYQEINNFPWKKLSDNKNKLIIKCKSCGLRCKGKNGISKHIFQHSKECYSFYLQKYGSDRLCWPEDTFLNFVTCLDCGKKLGDTSYRQSDYCIDCRSNKHNVMKIEEVKNKNRENGTITKRKPENRIRYSMKAKERFKNNPKYAENQRKYMLNGGSIYAASFIKNPSKPQVELYKRVKELYPSAILNYPCYPLNLSLDVAIPELKIWIESDGLYFHQDKEKDLERQRKIENLGWKCIRYVADNIKQVPTKEQVKLDVEKLIGG